MVIISNSRNDYPFLWIVDKENVNTYDANRIFLFRKGNDTPSRSVTSRFASHAVFRILSFSAGNSSRSVYRSPIENFASTSSVNPVLLDYFQNAMHLASTTLTRYGIKKSTKEKIQYLFSHLFRPLLPIFDVAFSIIDLITRKKYEKFLFHINEGPRVEARVRKRYNMPRVRRAKGHILTVYAYGLSLATGN